MDILKIKDLIEAIPYLFTYFIPGYLLIYCFCYFSSLNKDKTKEIIILSIIISWIGNIIIELIDLIIDKFKVINFDIAIKSVILITLSIVFGIYLGTKDKELDRIFKKISNKSFIKNIWNEIIDRENGIVIRLYLKNGKICEGSLVRYEEKEADYFLFLVNYRFYLEDIDNPNIIEQNDPVKIIKDKSISNNWVAMINSNNIDNIELIYKDIASRDKYLIN